METNNQIKVGDNVYLLVSPTNRNSYYIYTKNEEDWNGRH